MKALVCIILVLSLFLAPYPSQARSVVKTPRIGILTPAFGPNPLIEAFRFVWSPTTTYSHFCQAASVL
jgi:hypothetical protein